MQKWIILIVVLFTIILSLVIVFNFKVETDYIPETEIEDVELRKTIVSLYFQNKDTKELQKETRLIDSKELLQNPYKKLIEMLLEGPENDKLEAIIPIGVSILKTELQANCVIIDFSKEFIENATDETQKYNMINGIVNTLTELTEVNSVKIWIQGEEVPGFEDVGLDFRNEFTKDNIRRDA